jgi:hypothetical protein
VLLRLVNDAIWRQRWAYLPLGLLALVSWMISVEGETAAGLRNSLMMAYGIGPLAAIAGTSLREMRILPVTNRELWLSTWMVAVVAGPAFLVITALLAATIMLAATGHSPISAETIVLFALYAFLYCGALLPAGPLMGYSIGYASVRKPRWLWIAISTMLPLAFIGGLGFPWLFARLLPLSFDQFSIPTASVLVIGLLLTASGWAWTPQRGGSTRAEQSSSHRGSAAAGTPERLADRFTGLARIYVSHAAVTLAVSGLVAGGFVAYWAYARREETLVSFMQLTGLLPFMTSAPLVNDGLGEFTILAAVMLVAGSGIWHPFAKQLKVMPLTVVELNALFVTTPLITWALIWLVLLAVHVTVAGTVPPTLRLEMFMFAAGATAFGHMLALRFKRAGMAFPWFVGPLGIAVSILGQTAGTSPSSHQSLALASGGLVGFAIAAVVNHRTLTRSTSSANAYRAQLPIGVNAPAARL